MASLLKKQKLPAPLVVPTPAEASPEYGAMLAKQRELEAKRSAHEGDLRDIRKGRLPAHLIASATGGRADRAAQLLGDVVGDEPLAFGPSKADVADFTDKARQELADIESALGILKVRLPAASNAASTAVVDRIRDGYNAALRRTALALAPALAAHREVMRIVADLNDADVKWSGKLTQPTTLRRALGEAWDMNTDADRFIADTIAAGLVTDSEIKEAADA